MRKIVAPLVSSAAVALAIVAPLRAETINCTPINSVPFVISTKGLYCLTQDFTVNGNGVLITINASNVVLDMNGHRLANQASTPGGVGIYGAGQNITIKNGTIRGFSTGVLLAGLTSQANVVEGLRLVKNESVGVEVNGRGNLVRNNHVVETGPAAGGGAHAILVFGPGNRVINNDVVTVVHGGGGDPTSHGILFVGDFSVDNLAVDNRITDADEGVSFNFGATGKYRDNLTSAVATPYSGGTDAGNNN